MVQINNALSMGVAAVAMSSTVQADTCPALTMDSDLVKAVVSAADIKDADAQQVVNAIGSTSAGQCIASLKTSDVISLASALQNEQCQTIAQQSTLNKLTELLNKPESILTTEAAESCTLITTAASCVDEAVVDPLYKLLQSKDCCKAALDDVKKYAGDTMDTVVKTIVADASATVCSARPSIADPTKNVTCLESMAPAFGDKAMNVLQMPNDQAMNAFEGKAFQNTKKESVTFPKAYSSCAVPMDSLVSYVANMPIVKSTDGLNQLFAKDECLKAADVSSAAKEVPYLGDIVKELLPEGDNDCFHLANGYVTKDANWSVDAKLPNGKSVTTMSESQGSGSESKDGSSKKNAGALTSASVATLVVAAAQFLL